MAVTINGTTGISQVQDGIVTDDKLDLSANSAEVKEALNASGTAPIYACRAWVNFDGTGTVSIRASGNVSSITDNGTGDYTVNFATDMEDADYSFSANGRINTTGVNEDFPLIGAYRADTYLTTSLRIISVFRSSATTQTESSDPDTVTVAIFR